MSCLVDANFENHHISLQSQHKLDLRKWTIQVRGSFWYFLKGTFMLKLGKIRWLSIRAQKLTRAIMHWLRPTLFQDVLWVYPINHLIELLHFASCFLISEI